MEHRGSLLVGLPALGFVAYVLIRLASRIDTNPDLEHFKPPPTRTARPATGWRPPTQKPATLPEALRLAQEESLLGQTIDTHNIEILLRSNEERLARQAAAQVGAEHAVDVSCRAVGWTSTQQSESVAWGNVDFECRGSGTRLPNKTSVSIRLAKKNGQWVFD